MNLDDMEIIKVVQANPCLYAKDTKLYKNIDKKHSWEQVGAALSKPKTGEAVHKRWDSLRTMFMRAHRKRMEYIPSGSGANNDPNESDGIDFIYYAEMSFLIPHYKPRMTRSNMKVPTSIQIPSPTSASATADESVTNLPIDSVWNFDLTESVSTTGTENSCDSSLLSVPIVSPLPSPRSQSSSPCSPMLANNTGKINPVQFVPFSPSTINVMNSKDHTISESGVSGTSIVTNKFKRKADVEIVPPSDNFSKRKKNTMDAFLGDTVKMIDKMASTVETVVSSRQTKAAPLPEDNALASLSVTIANIIQDVPKEKRRKCLVKILQVIEEFAE